jgi:hypothetical protein
MPRKRQIPYLDGSRRTKDGRTIYDWNPSPRLRRLGHKRVIIGPVDLATACKQAIALNEALEKGAGGIAAAPARRDLPLTVAELVRDFKASQDWQELAPGTQGEYASKLRFILSWTNEGAVAVRAISADMVQDLRDALVKDGRKPRTAAILRVLRILLNYARRRRVIAENPAAHDLRIPEPPTRTRILSHEIMLDIVGTAERAGLHDLALAIELGFWSLQRQADLLALSPLNWRAIEDIDPRDRAALAGPDGAVMGFRLKQRKTGVWIDAPVPPSLRPKIEAAFARREGDTTAWLLPYKGGGATQQRYFQNHVRQLIDDMIEARGGREADKAAELLDIMFRDLRRSGMVFYGNWGATPPMITALSGHAIFSKKSILDTYMPGNTRSACACVATAVRKLAERSNMEESKG